MQRSIYVAAILLSLPITLMFGQEAESPLLNVQGTLFSGSGASIPDGERELTFRLYSTLDGADYLWQEQATVFVRGGLYNHVLGENTLLNTELFSDPLYLGISAEGFELSPRVLLTTAPYAVRAYTAETVESVAGCQGEVGEVKFSVLPFDKFREVNGDCWVELKGTPLPESSRLGELIDMEDLPDARGAFIRGYDYKANLPLPNPNVHGENLIYQDSEVDKIATDFRRQRTGNEVGGYQQDTFQLHSHPVIDPGHTHAWTDNYHGPDTSDEGIFDTDNLGEKVPDEQGRTTETAFVNATVLENGDGQSEGVETRPKNICLYIYLRIN
jgi:hypothetical protein